MLVLFLFSCWLINNLCSICLRFRSISFVGGTSPVQAVAAGLNHATTGAAGKAMNGIKVAYQQSGLTGKISSTVVTTQQPTGFIYPTSGEIYHSDTDMPPKKVRHEKRTGIKTGSSSIIFLLFWFLSVDPIGNK